MRRIIASLLVLSVVFSFWTVAYAEDEKTSYSNAMNLMYDLGIITGYEDGSLRPENNITRMEFVTMALRLMGYYSTDVSYTAKAVFEDVTSDLWGAGYINLSHELGLVDGYTETTFAPQDNVTINQAAKVLICILGYKTVAELDGYPNGYVSTGTDLSLFNDVGAGEVPATRDDVAKLMANALDANMMEVKYPAVGEGDYYVTDTTLLNAMGIEKRKGVVMAVPGVDIGTGIMPEDGKVVVGDLLYKTAKTSIYEDIASELEIWVNVEADEFNPTIVHYEKLPTRTEIEVSARDILPGTTTREFIYKNESGSKKSISLNSKTIYVYNGQLLASGQVTNDKLKPDTGYVVLKSDKNSDSTIVLIWDFENYIVKATKDSDIIYDAFGKKIDLYDAETKTVILDGQVVSLDEIQSGDVLSVAASPNGEAYKIYISREKMTGTIEKSLRNSNSEIVYTVDGADYYVSENYQTYVDKNPTKVNDLYVGDSTTFYLDYFGNVACTGAAGVIMDQDSETTETPGTTVTDGQANALKYGYIIDAEFEPVDEILYLEIMNDSNSFERLRVDTDEGSKCGIYRNGSYTVNKNNLRAVVNELIKDYGINRQLVKYKSSEDGLLKELCLLDTSGTSDIWGDARGNKTSMTYANGTLDGEFSIDANTIAFYIPNNGNDTNLFKSGRAVTLISSSSSKVQIYDIIDNRVGVVLLRGDEKGTTGYKYIIDAVNDPIMLVEEVTTGVVDDEEVICMSGWQDGKQVTVSFAKTLEKNSENIANIKPGMLIQYKVNSDIRSRAETSDEPSRVILFRTNLDLNTPMSPFQTWNMENDWMASASLRYAYGTVKSYSLPNMVLDCVEGEHSLAALSIDDSVNVIRWNRQENRGEKLSIYDVQVNDMILVRTRYNVTKDIYIFE